MKFNSQSIDFFKTYENFYKKYGARTVCRRNFGAPIVRMANAVITSRFDRKSVKGVKKCLEYEIEHISWRGYIWIIPLNKYKLFFGLKSDSDREVISLLADSLILTIISYRTALDDHPSGLSNIVFKEIINGFELVCYWYLNGVKIDQENDEFIEVFDVSHIKTFILER